MSEPIKLFDTSALSREAAITPAMESRPGEDNDADDWIAVE